jgi:hypothetical protein
MPQDEAEEFASDLLTIVSQLRLDSKTALKDETVRDASSVLFGDNPSHQYSDTPTMFIAFTRRGEANDMIVLEPPVDGTWEDFSKDETVQMVRSIVSNLRPDWLLHIFECFAVEGDQRTSAAAQSWVAMGQPLRTFPNAREELRAHLAGGVDGKVNIVYSRLINKDGTLGEVSRLVLDDVGGRYAATVSPLRDPYPGALDE